MDDVNTRAPDPLVAVLEELCLGGTGLVFDT